MSPINTISVNLHTGNVDGAGTDGDIYVGICGREFYIDSNSNDFERNASKVYHLGSGSNILHASTNDPRKPQVYSEEIDRFPVYIRFNPKNRDDRWNLAYMDIQINGQLVFQSLQLEREGGIWLGIRSGLFYYPRKHNDLSQPVIK